MTLLQQWPPQFGGRLCLRPCLPSCPSSRRLAFSRGPGGQHLPRQAPRCISHSTGSHGHRRGSHSQLSNQACTSWSAPAGAHDVGGLREELGTALRAELAAEARRWASPPPPTVSHQGTSTVPALVMNDRTKVVHVVAMGPEDTWGFLTVGVSVHLGVRSVGRVLVRRWRPGGAHLRTVPVSRTQVEASLSGTGWRSQS